MTLHASGQLRRSQVITTYGPGALIDLPRHSAIVGGLEQWPKPGDLDEVIEPRLARKLEVMTGVKAPKLYAPPADVGAPWESKKGIGVWQFPQWFVVQEKPDGQDRDYSRRLVHRRALDQRKHTFEGLQVVATRFVRACPNGHVDDIYWDAFIHGPGVSCKQQLWLDERGTSGDLADLVVRCACGKSRGMNEATDIDGNALGTCPGTRPWLGLNAKDPCRLPSRLLIRTAANAYFPQVMSVLSLPDRGTAVGVAITALWDDLNVVDDAAELATLKKKPRVARGLEAFGDAEVLNAIKSMKAGKGSDLPVKVVEVEAILAVDEGFGDDAPIDPDFHARRLPDAYWRKTGKHASVEAVFQLHRLREVLALAGFTRFEAVMPDIHGEYETDVKRAQLAVDPIWFPAVENRGEGVFVQLGAAAVRRWLARPAVASRLADLLAGHKRWGHEHKSARAFPGGPYVLLHTLSHVLIQSLSMTCGYPASSIRERIYADEATGRFGILLYTASPDADGTLGGLVSEARHVEGHLDEALRVSALCSNDPVCAHHSPAKAIEGRALHGAACHGCALIAETSCEMRNDYLDRALLRPVLGVPDAAFFT